VADVTALADCFEEVRQFTEIEGGTRKMNVLVTATHINSDTRELQNFTLVHPPAGLDLKKVASFWTLKVSQIALWIYSNTVIRVSNEL
jgi:hypothetical protein